MTTLANFWVLIGFFTVLGVGLIVDIVLAVIYWDRWPVLFKTKLMRVPWIYKDIVRIVAFLVLIYVFFYSFEYALLKTGITTKNSFRFSWGVLNTFGIYSLGILFVIYYIKKNFNAGWKMLGFRWQSWSKKSARSTLFYIGFLPILALLTYVGIVFCIKTGLIPKPHPLVNVLQAEQSIWYIMYLVFVAVFVAPLFEEIVFRGVIYQGLKNHGGVISAAFISSILFSALHCNTAQFLPVMGLGVLLCFIAETTGSLVPVIFIHMINNSLFLGLFFLLKENV